MSPKVENVTTESKIQVPFVEVESQYVNSAFTYDKHVTPSGNSAVGNKLATGDVGECGGITEPSSVESTPDKGEVSTYTKESFKQELLRVIDEVVNKEGLDRTRINLDLNSDTDITKILQAFTDVKTIKELLNKSKAEIDNILSKLAKDIATTVNSQWCLSDMCNRQNNVGKSGLSERLSGFSTEIRKKGFSNVSEAEQKRAITAFFNQFFKDMEGKKNHEEIVKLQLQTFGRILINSTDEEKAAFKEVIKAMLVENTSTALKETLESIDSIENKTKLANSFNAEEIKEIANTPDRYGNKISSEDLKDMVTILTQYKDKASIESDHKIFDEELSIFIETNKDLLETIQNKLEKNEPLTAEEQTLIEEFNRKKDIAAAEMVGTANSKVISNENDIKDLLRKMNEDNYNHGSNFYRDVMTKIGDYINVHPDVLIYSIEEFTALMNSITNGNYSIIMNDLESGEVSELYPPQSSTNNTSSQNSSEPIEQGGFGFTQQYTEQPVQTINPKDLYTDENANNQITLIKPSNDNNSQPTKSTNSLDSIIANTKEGLSTAINEHIKTIGVISFVHEAFNSKIAMKLAYVKDKTMTYFDNMSNGLKQLTFNGIHVSANAIMAARTMSTNELNKVSANNIYVAENIEKIKEEKEKKQNIA